MPDTPPDLSPDIPPGAPSDAPPPSAAPRRRWIGYALAASLAVNLAVLGLVAGLVLKGPPDRPGPEMGLWRYGAALPPPYREDLMRALRDGRQAWQAERTRLGGQRAALAAALTATPYDPGRVAAILASERDMLGSLAERGTGLLLAQIDRMDAEARAAYAARLLDPRPGHGPGSGPGPGPGPGPRHERDGEGEDHGRPHKPWD